MPGLGTDAVHTEELVGVGVGELYSGLERGDTGVRPMPDWDKYKGLESRVAAPAPLEERWRLWTELLLRAKAQAAQSITTPMPVHDSAR